MDAPRHIDSRDYVQSLERGLSVIQAFAAHRPELSLAEVAEATGLSRPTARRLLLTLHSLGYVRITGRKYALTPRVLSIGYAYSNSLDLTTLAQPVMERIVSEAREACTLAALDGSDIVYINRVSTRRLAHLTLAVGTRIPAYAAAMGQVLLADLSPDDLDEYFMKTELEALTPRTLRTEESLRERLGQVRDNGWAQADQELENGIRAVAVPIRGLDGRVFAALGISSTAVDIAKLRSQHLNLLLDSATELSVRLGSEYSTT